MIQFKFANKIFILILFVAQFPSLRLYSQNYHGWVLEHHIYIDGGSTGRTFEGFGALSAGASSRLLYEYPETVRSQILDYLFKPGFGANLHHLKVEIGGDVNSTDGSEPSHAVTREEFENPRSEYFFRGYEWWLMVEAKKRNPEIILEGLQWGAPGWIGDGNFFSEDNAEFVSAWIKGMKKYHNLDIDYVGIWNERDPEGEYIKLLRSVLDKNGLQQVKIDAGDLWEPHKKWKIADMMMEDPDLREAVDVINAHTTSFINYYTPPNAKELGIPLWDGEAHGGGGDWYAAAAHARNNRAYSTGGITKIISWSVITSYHDFLPAPESGLMKANTPWSGHYKVQTPLWILAHTNQFAKPGWKYINSACKSFNSEAYVKEGFSVSALKSDETNDYSIIIETMDAKELNKVYFTVSDDLSQNNLSVWQSTFKKEEFVRKEDIEVKDGKFEITLIPGAMYSLTTTSGQKKGVAPSPVPVNNKFPFPYSEDFEETDFYKTPEYFCDQHGRFEVVDNPYGKGRILEQKMPVQGILWRKYETPQTIVGDIGWKDYTVSIDVMLPDTGCVSLCGRFNRFIGWDLSGYSFQVNHNGNWKLQLRGKILASGNTEVNLNKWNKLIMSFKDDVIEVKLNKKIITTIKDSTIMNGVVALGTGWNTAYFDNLRIE